MNRRDFVSSAVAAASLTTFSLRAAGASWLQDADQAALVRPCRLIFDTRFPAARLLGAAAVQHGVASTAFNGDVTALWFHDIGPQWATGRAPVAGITTPEALLCLEQMACDAWMRVAVRIEHADVDARPCAHRVSGRMADVTRICAALEAGADWPGRLSAALATTSMDDGRRPSQQWVAGGARWLRDGRGPRLVSWVITA